MNGKATFGKHMWVNQNDIIETLSHFSLTVPAAEVVPFGDGLINATYRVCDVGGTPKYILQRINHTVFKDVEGLQRNILRVTDHIRQKLIARNETAIDRKTLTLVPTIDGQLYHFDGKSYWRVYQFIAHSKTLTQLTPQSARLAGELFGDFQYLLSDLPEGAIIESIPNFHNMPLRLLQLEQALTEDRAGRADAEKRIVEELISRKETYCLQEQLYCEGRLSKRINHCDTKLNNILFDEDGTPLCVVDLDTVMPDFVLSDFGDFVRTGGNTAAEDEADLSKIALNREVILSYADGYLSRAARFLTPTEAELLAYGAALMTYMQAVRFFTDYLNGDVYYKTAHPQHNLQRTRAQFRLLQLLEAEQEILKDKLVGVYGNYLTEN